MSSHPQALTQTIDIDGVLFDMDGTLVDSTAVVEHLWRRFATRFGLDPTELLAYAHGRQTRDTIARYVPAGHDAEGITAAFEREELTETRGITEVPGARRLLTRLSNSRVAIVTSAPRALAEVRLAAARIPLPGILVCGDDVEHGKPDPEGYATAARHLGLTPDRCLVVEDAEAGIQAGLAAGARVLVVGAGRSGADATLPHVDDLTAVSATASEERIRLTWTTRAQTSRGSMTLAAEPQEA